MCISKKKCPVPFDQQPLNEYFALKESKLFSWSICDKKTYLLNIFYLSTVLFALSYPLVFSIILKKQCFIQYLVIDSLFVNVMLILVFLRLYLGWSYVTKRLLSATIFYEESGWYDGQIWIKTAESLIQDRLIGLYELVPFLQRIKYTGFFFVIFLFFDIIILCLL
uniref:Ycf36 n=1 Tax=Antithamnion hubbsii TaxID=1005974 RepID=A0A4D6WL42_9FLOR|nr:hypothetical protein [Antithamnion hubbsii]